MRLNSKWTCRQQVTMAAMNSGCVRAKRSADESVTQDWLDHNFLYRNYGTTRVHADKGSIVYSNLFKPPD